MKQGLLPPRAKLQVACGAIAIFLFFAWYWTSFGFWKIEAPSAHAPLPIGSQISFDQQIVIPKVPRGARSLRWNSSFISDEAGVASGWTPIDNGRDPGQLRVDVTSIHLWREVERDATFQFIPQPHTMDENRGKPILYELLGDSFKCSDGTAVKKSLTVYYEDGTHQDYFPWGYAALVGIWKPVARDTALSREMKFVCAVHLATPSPASANFDQDRILGTWHVDSAQGRIAAGPIVISETSIAWTANDNHACVSDYVLASRSAGPTFPGGPTGNNNFDDAYTTFVLELKGPHLHPCSQKMRAFTISLSSAHADLGHFAAFFVGVQAHGTMHRAPIRR